MKPTALQKAALEAREAHRLLLKAVRDEREQRLKKYAEEIACDLALRFNAQIRELNDAACAAEQAELAEREQLATKNLPYPVGTKLCKWEDVSQGWGRTSHWEHIGYGIVEICTRETVHPAGMSHYSRAAVGKILVRLLKKDGTPSLKYDELDRMRGRRMWLPEGKTPKGYVAGS